MITISHGQFKDHAPTLTTTNAPWAMGEGSTTDNGVTSLNFIVESDIIDGTVMRPFNVLYDLDAADGLLITDPLKDPLIGLTSGDNVDGTHNIETFMGTYHGMPGTYKCAVCEVAPNAATAAADDSIFKSVEGPVTFTPTTPVTPVTLPDPDYLTLAAWSVGAARGHSGVATKALGADGRSYLGLLGTSPAVAETVVYTGRVVGWADVPNKGAPGRKVGLFETAVRFSANFTRGGADTISGFMSDTNNMANTAGVAVEVVPGADVNAVPANVIGNVYIAFDEATISNYAVSGAPMLGLLTRDGGAEGAPDEQKAIAGTWQLQFVGNGKSFLGSATGSAAFEEVINSVSSSTEPGNVGMAFGATAP